MWWGRGGLNSCGCDASYECAVYRSGLPADSSGLNAADLLFFVFGCFLVLGPCVKGPPGDQKTFTRVSTKVVLHRLSVLPERSGT